MKNNYKRETAILIFVCILLAAAVVGVYYQYTNLNEARESLEEEQERLSGLETQLAFLEEIQEREEEINAQLELFREFVPASPRKDDLVNTLYEATPDEGELTAIRIDSVINNGSYNQIPFNITYTGRYGEVIELINDLHEDNRIFKVYNVTIYEGEEGFPTVNADISAESFFSDSF